jgi:ketosteroid isomerase-like protein
MREVRGAERRLEHALMQADAPAMDRLLGDDFFGVGPDGRTYTRADVLKALRRPPSAAVEAAGDLVVRLYAGAAVVQGRGRDIGLAPQTPPGERVFTDTWVRTHGRWRMAASEAVDPGAQTPALYASDRAEILALRSASNGFIAAHDLSRFTPMFADDAVFVWSDGSSAVGKAGLSARFAKEFADPAFVTLVRTPQVVAVSDLGARAVEHGAWTAFRRDARGETVAGGDYAAHWSGWGQDGR